MDRTFVAIGALLGGLAVAAGAFGAHALEGRLSLERMDVYQTAARYQMYHALALVGVGILARTFTARPAGLAYAGWLFVAGVLVFCGTLYALAFGAPRWLGAVTPLGGVAFIGGWACLAWAALASTRP